MTKHVASTTKKFLAAGGLAFGLAGFGLFAGVGTAVADGTLPDTGTSDELVEVHDGTLVNNIFDSNATHEVPDTGSYPADASWPGGNAKP
jgi:hypothetical protein